LSLITRTACICRYFGKNDFWGWPEAVTYHASFQHFSPGYLLLGLSNAAGDPIALPHFNGSMSLEDGQLSATASSSGGDGYSLRVDALVMSAQNTIMANLTASCPPSSTTTTSGSSTSGSALSSGGGSVELELTLSSDTIFSMPLNVSSDPAEGTLRLTKANVFNGGLSEPVMVPCTHDIIVYNSLRTFKVEGGALTVHNASGGPPLCLSLQQQDSHGDADEQQEQEEQEEQEQEWEGGGGAAGRRVVTVPGSASAATAGYDGRGEGVAPEHRWVLESGELRHTDAAVRTFIMRISNITHSSDAFWFGDADALPRQAQQQ
jgi:hypothetical protein